MLPLRVCAMALLVLITLIGLDILEKLYKILRITLEKIFDDHGRKILCSEFPPNYLTGFCMPRGGICLSSMGPPISYERVVA